MASNRYFLILLLSALICPWALAQPGPRKVEVQVHVDRPDGTIASIWNYFGYDEPNYSYAANGRKLLGELGALGRTPAYVRVHNLLTTGDGSASLKWGSTNVYTEDAAGKASLQLDHTGPHFRQLSGGGSKAAGRNWFHARGACPLIRNPIVIIFRKARSLPDGLILPRIIRSGQMSSTNLSTTCASAMATPR